MKKYYPIIGAKTLIALVVILTTSVKSSNAQTMPYPALVGYLHAWDEGAMRPFIQPKDVDPRFNVINYSFAVRLNGNLDMKVDVPMNTTQFKQQILDLQAAGKKFIISIGGATDQYKITSNALKDNFVNSMRTMINEYNFDGIDIDYEGSSIQYTDITIGGSTDGDLNRLIQAIKEIMVNYRIDHGKKCLLTMAPETIYVQGGLSQWAGAYKGAYLPMIEELRDSIDLMMVQLYNSGQMFGLDGAAGGAFNQGTGDFIVSQTEAVIQGFTSVGGIGVYSGLPERKVAVALPACGAAGQGYVNPATVEQAIDYLRGETGRPAGFSYTLKQAGGYPNLGGMMTWSINNDAMAWCASTYEYAANFETIFNGVGVGVDETSSVEFNIFPNPTQDQITINIAETGFSSLNYQIYNFSGEVISSGLLSDQSTNIDLSNFASGMYFVHAGNTVKKIVKN